MTRKNRSRTTSEIKAMMAEDGDFLRPIVRTVIEEFLEAERQATFTFSGQEIGDRIPGRRAQATLDCLLTPASRRTSTSNASSKARLLVPFTHVR
jgi:hypothetical protein